MNEWMSLPVSQIKRLVKSRAGRIAELQMEIKILEGIMDKKVRDGDLGGSAPSGEKPKTERPKAEKPGEDEPAETPSKAAGPEPEDGADAPVDEEAGDENPGPEKAAGNTEQSKISDKSSSHAFREID